MPIIIDSDEEDDTDALALAAAGNANDDDDDEEEGNNSDAHNNAASDVDDDEEHPHWSDPVVDNHGTCPLKAQHIRLQHVITTAIRLVALDLIFNNPYPEADPRTKRGVMNDHFIAAAETGHPVILHRSKTDSTYNAPLLPIVSSCH